MRLFLLTTIILIAVTPPSQTKQQQPKTQDKQGGTTVSSSPCGGVTVIVNQPTAAQQTERPKQDTQNRYSWIRQWFAPATLLNLALVIIAGIAAKFALHSLGEVRKQAESTEKAANAARDNAEAVMRGERAWLLIDKIEAVDDFANQGTPRFYYWVANHGKTPGFAISAKAYVQWEGGTDVPSDFEFMDRAGGIVEDSVIPPNGEPLRLFGNDLTMDARQFHLSEVPDEKRFRLYASPPTAYLWAVGSIHYHDVFGQVHSTPFAYWFDARKLTFVRSRWPGSNKPK